MVIVEPVLQLAAIRVKAGRPVCLHVHRTDPSGCVAQVIVPEFQRSLDLPLGAVTSIELVPALPGVYPFHCRTCIPSTAA
jgi:plastocyanin domain-containing protein